MNKEKEIKSDFEQACINIKQVSNLENEILLELYGLYKQALEGDCNINKPGFFDLKAQAKWTAWNDNKGLDSLTAMRRYVRKVKSILN